VLRTHNDLDRPHVVIHVRPQSPVSDEGLSQAWVARFLCDATVKELRKDPTTEPAGVGLQRPHGNPGPTPGVDRQRPHLRDPELLDPGPLGRRASRPVVVERRPTNVSSMAMVCGPHHADIQAGTWILEMRNGCPVGETTEMARPEQRWRRNTYNTI
jgi:hypothetical protein